MRKYFYVLFLVLVFSCDDALFDSGDMVTEKIEVSHFRDIFIEDVFDVFLIQDTVCKIEVKGGSKLLPNLEFTVDSEERLYIYNHNSARWSRNYDKIELYISVDTLWFLQLNEPSTIKTQNTLITPELKIFSIADYAQINIDILCNNCYIVNSGTSGGILNITGQTHSLTFWSRGSFQINALNFISNLVNVKQESMANCSIYANKELSVEILGDGNLFYKGNPEIKYMNESAKEQLIPIKE